MPAVRSGRDPTGGGIFNHGAGNGGTVMYGLTGGGGGGGGLGGGPAKYPGGTVLGCTVNTGAGMKAPLEAWSTMMAL